MGQFGLLAIPVLLVMMLLSGATTPMESMPVWLQYLTSAAERLAGGAERQSASRRGSIDRGSGILQCAPDMWSLTSGRRPIKTSIRPAPAASQRHAHDCRSRKTWANLSRHLSRFATLNSRRTSVWVILMLWAIRSN